MYCENCGKQLSDNAKFCPECGTKTDAEPEQAQAPAQAQADDDNLVGWSPHANDPLFRKNTRKNNKNMMIAGFVVGAVEIAALSAYGYFSDYGKNFIPLLCVGCGLAVFTVIWALKHSYARGNTENWDGAVTDKRIVQKKRKVYDDPSGDNDTFSWEKYQVYEIVIQKQDGSYHTMGREDRFVFDNYAIGDRVRWHGFIGYLEKYDKRNSRYIFCAKCGNDCNPKLDFCDHCDAPLFKGAGTGAFRAQSNSPLPNDPGKDVKFIGFDKKIPKRGSHHLRNFILVAIIILIVIAYYRFS